LFINGEVFSMKGDGIFYFLFNSSDNILKVSLIMVVTKTIVFHDDG